MNDPDSLLRQWHPAACKAAHDVARKFKATPQEHEDIYAMAPAALWLSIRAGKILHDTPASHVVQTVRGVLVQGPPHPMGIKSWRPDSYFARVNGHQRYNSRPEMSDVTELLWLATVADDTSDPAELVDALARVVGLTRAQYRALLDCARGIRQEDTGAECGISRGMVSHSLREAVTKLRKHEPRVRALLGF